MKDDTVSVTHRMTLIVIMPRHDGLSKSNLIQSGGGGVFLSPDIIILSVTWVLLDSELPRCLLYGIQFTFDDSQTGQILLSMA